MFNFAFKRLLFIGVGLLALNFLLDVGGGTVRWDMTDSKRFTLSDPTKKLLANLDKQVNVTVFMTGNVKASDKRFVKSIRELFADLQSHTKGMLLFDFVNPFESNNDSVRIKMVDSLASLGLTPYTLRAQDRSIYENEQRVIIPGAIVQVGGKRRVINFFEGLRVTNEEELFERAASLLEYRLASSIELLLRERLQKIYFTSSHNEPMDLRMVDFFQTVARHYHIDTLNLHSAIAVPKDASLVIVFYPTKPFTEAEKMKIDQYVMEGGKAMFYIGGLRIDDSRSRESGELFFVNQSANIDDILFRYGCRIEYALVKDLQSATTPIVVGEVGGRAQINTINWPYYPLLNPNPTHVITKNLDPILAKYATWLTILDSEQSRATVLLSSSDQSQLVGTPAHVSISEAQQIDPLLYRKKKLPVGVLIEGKLPSFYYSRLTAKKRQLIADKTGSPLPAASTPTSIMVVANPQILINEVNSKGIVPMGHSESMNFTFSNKHFLLNSLAYMCNPGGVIGARSKEFVLQMLNKEKVEQDAFFWKILTLMLPLVLLTLFSIAVFYFRWTKYRR